MKRQFIPDKEIILSSESDILKTKVYANNLTKLIENAPKNKVFSIGLFGSWGSGKSSIVETVKNNLETNDSKDALKVKFITYDAWKYVNDSFRRMFLLKVQEELKQEQTDEMKRFYESVNAEAKPKQVINIKGMSLFLSLLILVIIGVYVSEFEVDTKVTIAAIIALGGLMFTVANGVFHNLKISITKPLLFAPEQFEDCFKQMMAISLKKENCIIRSLKKLIEFVRRGENSITNLDKIVIVIDNIDRCDSATAYHLLTDIKTFLSDENYQVVFVIPVDDEALRKHLLENKNSKSSDCHKDTEEFLRKFFNVVIRIKPHLNTEMYAFAKGINDKYQLGLNSDTISIVSKEFAKNPRRIIQLFNNISAEFNNYHPDFISQNEVLICVILIIREEYNDYYKTIINDHKLLIDGKIPEINNKEPEWSNISELKDFLSLAKYSTQKADLSVVHKILTNSDAVFESIPSDVQDSIAKFNFDKLKTYVDAEGNIGDILEFIIKRASMAIKYEVSSDISLYFELIAKINQVKEVSSSDNKKFIAVFSNSLSSLLERTSECDAICNYSNSLFKQGINEPRSILIKYLTDNYGSDKPNINSYCNSALNILNDIQCSKELASFFEAYLKENYIDREITYSDEQLKFMFSDRIVANCINEITEIVDDEKSKELLWIFTHKPNISKESYQSFFTHINDLVGDMRNKTKDEIISVIEFLTPFVKSIKDRTLKEEPKEIFLKLFNERGISHEHPSYANSPQHDRKVNLVDECIEIAEDSYVLIDFCLQIYATTGGGTDVTQQITKFGGKYREYINSGLVKLLDRKFTLPPLFNFIVEDSNYDSDNSILLIRNCLVQRNKEGKLYISESQLQTKISQLVDIAATNDKAKNILIEFKDDVIIKPVIIRNITPKTPEFINSLPAELSTLAISAFTAENAELYADNYSYLKVVASKGSPVQKSTIVNLLQRKTIEDSNINEILEVIKLLSGIKLEDKNLLYSILQKYNADQSVGEEIQFLFDEVCGLLAPKKGDRKK